MKKFIKNKQHQHFIWKSISIFIKDPFNDPNIKIEEILEIVEGKVPASLVTELDSIYVGYFDFLNDRDLQAMYIDSSIYLSNEQSSVDDAADDLIHEISHSLEQKYNLIIYGDGSLEREFEQKRKEVWSILKSEGLVEYESLQNFLNLDYDEGFDNFLYQEIGYPMLAMLSANIFYSPYAVTSLREYFANGFEAYFYHQDIKRLKNISPNLYNILIKILEQAEEETGESYYENNGKIR